MRAKGRACTKERTREVRWGQGKGRLITDQPARYQPVNYQPEKVEARACVDKDTGEEKSEVE